MYRGCSPVLEIDLRGDPPAARESFGKKQALVDANMKGGTGSAIDSPGNTCPARLPLRVERMDKTRGTHDRRQQAAALRLRVRRRDVAPWYPIRRPPR